MTRPFRFGVQASKPPGDQDWVSFARKAEDLGYSSLLLPDHFGDQYGPIPAMAAAAAATTLLRVGALVFGNDYRHPVVLAKDIATVDVLSGGRVEFGLGAGWMTSDYEQAGMPKDRDGERIERLAEALAVCKGLWADGAFSYSGSHYTIDGLDGQPKPVQRPHPPMIVGGGGKRLLTLAAREADIVGINPALSAGEVTADAGRDAVASRVDQKVRWVREAAGDRYEEIELSVLVFVAMVTDDRRSMAEALAPAFGITADEALEVPQAWVGTVDEICESLEAWRDRWDFSYWVIQGDAMESMAEVVARLAGK